MLASLETILCYIHQHQQEQMFTLPNPLGKVLLDMKGTYVLGVGNNLLVISNLGWK